MRSGKLEQVLGARGCAPPGTEMLILNSVSFCLLPFPRNGPMAPCGFSFSIRPRGSPDTGGCRWLHLYQCPSPGLAWRPFEISPDSKWLDAKFNYRSRNMAGGRASFSRPQTKLTLVFLSPNQKQTACCGQSCSHCAAQRTRAAGLLPSHTHVFWGVLCPLFQTLASVTLLSCTASAL